MPDRIYQAAKQDEVTLTLRRLDRELRTPKFGYFAGTEISLGLFQLPGRYGFDLLLLAAGQGRADSFSLPIVWLSRKQNEENQSLWSQERDEVRASSEEAEAAAAGHVFKGRAGVSRMRQGGLQLACAFDFLVRCAHGLHDSWIMILLMPTWASLGALSIADRQIAVTNVYVCLARHGNL